MEPQRPCNTQGALCDFSPGAEKGTDMVDKPTHAISFHFMLFISCVTFNLSLFLCLHSSLCSPFRSHALSHCFSPLLSSLFMGPASLFFFFSSSLFFFFFHDCPSPPTPVAFSHTCIPGMYSIYSISPSSPCNVTKAYKQLC